VLAAIAPTSRTGAAVPLGGATCRAGDLDSTCRLAAFGEGLRSERDFGLSGAQETSLRSLNQREMLFACMMGTGRWRCFRPPNQSHDCIVLHDMNGDGGI